jgi:hypothetical protein
LDENLKKIGAKIEAYHGGDLNGGSSRAVMEKAKEFFEMIKTSLIDAKHDECKLTNEQIKEMMQHYTLLYTELGSCFSYICQILPTDEDLLHLKMSINNARKLWKDVLPMVTGPLLLFVTQRLALAASEESELESLGGTSPGSCTSSSLFLVNV